MPRTTLQVIPVQAPVQTAPFPLIETIVQACAANDAELQSGDVLAISSKYVAISEGRIVDLDTVEAGEKALELAQRYNMDTRIAELATIPTADEIARTSGDDNRRIQRQTADAIISKIGTNTHNRRINGDNAIDCINPCTDCGWNSPFILRYDCENGQATHKEAE